MKFIAILKDSLREAIDAKVLYVLMGLSLLMALLTLSVTFEPLPGGQAVIRQYAVLPLNADASNLSQAQTFQIFFRARPIAFDVVSVTPLDGAPDVPASAFKVELKASFNAKDEAEKAKADPEGVERFIRDHFGMIEGRRMMEATDVHFGGWEGNLPILGGLLGGGGSLKGSFTLTALPTPVTYRFWPHKFGIFFGALHPFGDGGSALFEQILVIENLLVGWAGNAIAVLVSIIVTAFFIPNMLRKGSVDLLLAKPISRIMLLLYKYVGGLTFMFLNTTVAVLGVWAALGLRSGIWGVSFLLTIVVLTFIFAILYSASTLFGVVTRSPVAAILLTCGLWAAIFLISITNGFINTFFRTRDRVAQAVYEKYGDEGLDAVNNPFNPPPPEGGGDPSQPAPAGKPRVRYEDLRFHENWFTLGVSFLYHVFPRTNELFAMTSRQVQHDLALGEPIPPPEIDKPLELPGGIQIKPVEEKPTLLGICGGSLVFIAVMLGVACWWFATKDY